MFSNKVFRPLFIAAASAIMLLATVEAAPAGSIDRFCPSCDEIPPCELNCIGGFCAIEMCRCTSYCVYNR
ncbi:hypothetical protein CPB97_000888 [Podila verticillata]|nr:hypothetical protein CPB97_000888 [Podila verticillata]